MTANAALIALVACLVVAGASALLWSALALLSRSGDCQPDYRKLGAAALDHERDRQARDPRRWQ